MYYFINSIIKLSGMIPDAKIGLQRTCRLIFLDIQFTELGIYTEKYKPFSIPVTGSPHEPDRYNREPVG